VDRTDKEWPIGCNGIADRPNVGAQPNRWMVSWLCFGPKTADFISFRGEIKVVRKSTRTMYKREKRELNH
jgi:hypothetical protein